jgi:hypothetical protein
MAHLPPVADRSRGGRGPVAGRGCWTIAWGPIGLESRSRSCASLRVPLADPIAIDDAANLLPSTSGPQSCFDSRSCRIPLVERQLGHQPLEPAIRPPRILEPGQLRSWSMRHTSAASGRTRQATCAHHPRLPSEKISHLPGPSNREAAGILPLASSRSIVFTTDVTGANPGSRGVSAAAGGSTFGN